MYFVGWQEEYCDEEGTIEYFAYTKNDCKITIWIDCRGWTPQMSVKGMRISVEMGYGDCEIPEKYNKNNIKERVKEAYKRKSKRDKTTGLYIVTRYEDLTKLYIEFLIENGILASSGSMV